MEGDQSEQHEPGPGHPAQPLRHHTRRLDARLWRSELLCLVSGRLAGFQLPDVSMAPD